ncbi:MAG: hypothetical protein V3T42_07545 [Nitrospirales bacterium]
MKIWMTVDYTASTVRSKISGLPDLMSSSKQAAVETPGTARIFPTVAK